MLFIGLLVFTAIDLAIDPETENITWITSIIAALLIYTIVMKKTDRFTQTRPQKTPEKYKPNINIKTVAYLLGALIGYFIMLYIIMTNLKGLEATYAAAAAFLITGAIILWTLPKVAGKNNIKLPRNRIT